MEITVHSKNSVSRKVSKEIVQFKQAQVRTPNLRVQCKRLFNFFECSKESISDFTKKPPTPGFVESSR